jgi:hypothetical protein
MANRDVPEYRTWCGMKARCADQTNHRYGGRGIRVCERWASSFEAFLADMGSKPSDTHTIDRIDNNGNYEPGNCRWATRSEQTRNREGSVQVTIRGETMPLAEAAKRYGLSYSVAANRVGMVGNAGLTIEEAFDLPIGRTRQEHGQIAYRMRLRRQLFRASRQEVL